jgi:hypothetical protein
MGMALEVGATPASSLKQRRADALRCFFQGVILEPAHDRR